MAEAALIHFAGLGELIKPVEQGLVLSFEAGQGLTHLHQLIEHLIGGQLIEIESLNEFNHGK